MQLQQLKENELSNRTLPLAHVLLNGKKKNNLWEYFHPAFDSLCTQQSLQDPVGPSNRIVGSLEGFSAAPKAVWLLSAFKKT